MSALAFPGPLPGLPGGRQGLGGPPWAAVGLASLTSCPHFPPSRQFLLEKQIIFPLSPSKAFLCWLAAPCVDTQR